MEGNTESGSVETVEQAAEVHVSAPLDSASQRIEASPEEPMPTEQAPPSKKNFFLRTLREGKGLTQREVAKKIGVDFDAYKHAEQGRFCGEAVAQKIARYFGHPVEDLVPQYHRRTTNSGGAGRGQGKPEGWTDPDESIVDQLFRRGYVGLAFKVLKHWLKKRDKEAMKLTLQYAYGRPPEQNRTTIPGTPGTRRWKGAILLLGDKQPIDPLPVQEASFTEEKEKVGVLRSSKAGEKAA